MGACMSATVTEAAEAPGEVHLTLEKEADLPLGLSLRRRRGGIVVQGVEEGSTLALWNDRHPGLAIEQRDRIVSVNGVAAEDSWESWCRVLEALRGRRLGLVVLRSARQQKRRQRLPLQDPQDQVLPADFVQQLEAYEAEAGEECAVCLEALRGQRRAVALPCGHGFHAECAERWLARCPTYRQAHCPTCRQALQCQRRYSSSESSCCTAAACSEGDMAVWPEALFFPYREQLDELSPGALALQPALAEGSAGRA